MKITDLKDSSVEREALEKKALEVICACNYYDLADNVDSMSNEELQEIITNNGVECDTCD